MEHMQDVVMNDKEWFSVKISDELAATVEESLLYDERIVTLTAVEAVGLGGMAFGLNGCATMFYVEFPANVLHFVGAIEPQTTGEFYAHGFGGSHFWDVLAVEDALIEVLS